MKLSYPLNTQNKGYPPFITQPFGANADYYARFGTKGHMGIDFMATHGTPVYAAHDGFAVYLVDVHGGDGVYIRFQDEDEPTKWWTVINWHLIALGDPKGPLVGANGRKVNKGELIGFSDNTGAPWESTGDHLHFGLAPCDKEGNFTEHDNGFGGCVDPKPFFAISLSASDQVAVVAAQKMGQGNIYQANVLFALAKFLKSFGK